MPTASLSRASRSKTGHTVSHRHHPLLARVVWVLGHHWPLLCPERLGSDVQLHYTCNSTAMKFATQSLRHSQPILTSPACRRSQDRPTHNHNPTPDKMNGNDMPTKSHGLTTTRRIFNCFVDDTALIAGLKKSTRDGIKKWVNNQATQVFVPLHSE